MTGAPAPARPNELNELRVDEGKGIIANLLCNHVPQRVNFQLVDDRNWFRHHFHGVHEGFSWLGTEIAVISEDLGFGFSVKIQRDEATKNEFPFLENNLSNSRYFFYYMVGQK